MGKRTLSESLGFSGELAKKRVGRLQRMVRGRWAMLAILELKSTRRAYLAGMSVNVDRRGTIQMELTGMIPGMVERGAPSRDMTAALLSGRSARTAADGSRYAVVPFRHLVTDLRTAGVYPEAKRLAAGQHFGPDRGHFAGLRRQAQPSGRGTYHTFRTVSSRGRPWRVGRVRARRFMRRIVQRELPKMLAKVL